MLGQYMPIGKLKEREVKIQFEAANAGECPNMGD